METCPGDVGNEVLAKGKAAEESRLRQRRPAVSSRKGVRLGVGEEEACLPLDGGNSSGAVTDHVGGYAYSGEGKVLSAVAPEKAFLSLGGVKESNRGQARNLPADADQPAVPRDIVFVVAFRRLRLQPGICNCHIGG